MRIVAGVGDLVQRIEDGRIGQVLGGRTIERSSGAVCGLHRARGDEECGFLVELQNQGRRFVSGLASKPLGRFLWFGFKTGGDGFLVEPQNQGGGGFSGLGLKTGSYGFGDLGLKITTVVSWFVPHNQAGFGLSFASQNRWENAMAWETHRDLAAYFTWKQVGLGFSSLASRLVETRRWVVHVTSSRRLRQS
jgi:hypothetical protein